MSSATCLAFKVDCFCNEIFLNTESQQVLRMTNVFGSFGEWEVQLRKEQNELKQLKLKIVRLRSK